jgi:hypothetical protein
MFGERVDGYAIPVLNEREVRAGAGILFFITLTVFLGAWHADQMLPAQMMIIAFFLDFLIRVVNPRYAPSLILGRIVVSNQIPEYTAAAPKRFAWGLGLALATIMLVTLIFMRNMSILNFAICGFCIFLLFLESAFGICLGCLVYHKICKEHLDLCAGGICQVKRKEAIQEVDRGQLALVAGFAGAMVVVFNVMVEQNAAHAHHGPNHQLLQQMQGKDAMPAMQPGDHAGHAMPTPMPAAPAGDHAGHGQHQH